ncbi:MAG: Ig-like domain-containing protein [Thermodesulfobacteriota bacterium]
MSGSVFVGQAVQLMVRNFVLGPVTVTSSNPQVAVVEGESAPYTVRGISAGDTTITVTDASETSATLAISVRMP